jgi:hypothetical protein
MMLQPLAGLSCEKTRKIFHLSRICVIGVLITFGTVDPTAALGGDSGTRSFARVAALSHATRLGRPPISLRRIDTPDAHADLSDDGRVVDQLYKELMRESARVLNAHE